MTTTGDLNTLLDDIDQRLFDLQSFLASDGGLGNNTFGQIIIAGSGGTNYFIDPNVSAPTGLAVTPGTFVDRIFADVTWTAPADSTAASYDVEWAKRNGASSPYTYELVDSKRVGGNSIRLDNLLPHQWYGVRVYSVNKIGLRTAIPASGFQDFQTSGDSSVPGSPGGLTVFAAIRSLIATWNDNSEPDVTFGAGVYRVQVATDAAFTNVIKDTTVSGTIATFVDLTAATSYYVRVAAIDSSGNEGPMSAGVTNTTGQVGLGDMAVNSVGANQIVANSIASSHIATVGLDAGTILFGTLDGNSASIVHLKANNIDTSSITASTITLAGGALVAGSPPTTGLLINSQGLRLYSGGVAQIILDSGGTATFSGTVTGATITGTTSITIGNYSLSPSTFSVLASTSYSDTRAIKWIGTGGYTQARLWTYDQGNQGKTYNGILHMEASEIDLSGDTYRLANAAQTATYITIFGNGTGNPGNVILGSGQSGSQVSVSSGSPLMIGGTGAAAYPAVDGRGYGGFFDNSQDIGIVWGGPFATVRIVNAIDNDLRDINARSYLSVSDVNEKEIISNLADGEALAIVVGDGGRPFRYRFKTGTDEDKKRIKIGMSAIALPPEARQTTKVRKLDAPPVKMDPKKAYAEKDVRTIEMVDASVQISILWGAIQDLSKTVTEIQNALPRPFKQAKE